jgi:predicted dehydrogenase
VKRLRIAVVGTGHLGSRHAAKLAAAPQVEFVAVCDPDNTRGSQIASQTGTRWIADYRQLAGLVDAVTIATPTATHAEVASFFLEQGVAVLVEKPITSSLAAGRQLVALARSHALALAVGHVERFNPALCALRRELTTPPRYIESYRISPFRFRSTDIGVVHDLMIHDIDIILELIAAPVERVEAHGVGVFGKREDIASARLVFRDGSVASATASRVSLKSERTLRLFADDLYATMDLEQRRGRVIRRGAALRDGRIDPTSIDPRTLENPMAFILGELIDVRELTVAADGDALADELADFIDAVLERRDPQVTGEDGVRALEVAELVVAGVEASLAQARAARP